MHGARLIDVPAALADLPDAAPNAIRPVLTSVAFQEAGGRADYYDASGRSVRKMFLRAPLDFTRITSGFSHARHHPILGGLRPHLAVDYGAPVGTPSCCARAKSWPTSAISAPGS